MPTSQSATVDPWITSAARQITDRAEPWLKMSDDELWSLMFSHKIPRSHHVWSDGHCPACKASVPMYEWKIDALKLRWKVSCPRCAEVFPKNDFEAFHQSGLDAAGWFDPERADRAMLKSTNHPTWIDDGNGLFDDGHRWLFIASYMLYGHWRQLIVPGVKCLADAFKVTGQEIYAHKALILLDRVADIFPEFDYPTQGWMYEKRGTETSSHGHVAYWCDNCEHIRELAESYVLVKNRADDSTLIAFLREKSARFSTPMPKRSGAEIRANIETRIFQDAMSKPIKFRSNFPRAEITKVAIHEAFGTPESLTAADELIDTFIRDTVQVDGVTGEKGLPTYSSYVISSLAGFLAKQERKRAGFMKEWCEREPKLKCTWRFFLDTRCLGLFYPDIGDGLWFGAKAEALRGVPFPLGDGGEAKASTAASPFFFFWSLYEATGDADYVRALYEANGSRLDELPRDISEADPAGFRAKVSSVIQSQGATIRLPSVNKTEWHLAILRSGDGSHERALWIDYDSGGNHGHMDGMNVGLFAHGLDLIPDFGYPPVQFGGWNSTKSLWYYKTAAHNTVTVDGQSQRQVTSWSKLDKAENQSAKKARVMLPTLPAGTTTLWRDQPPCQVVRIDGQAIYEKEEIKQYERTLMLIDVDATRFYVVDVFRVVGGNDHANFTHGHFGTIETQGVNLTPAADYGHETLMSNFRTDETAKPGWTATWHIEDRLGHLPKGKNLKMRRHDFTHGASASTLDSWINAGTYNDAAESTIPRLLIRKKSAGGNLSSCFVSVLEVYEREPVLSSVRRIALSDEHGTVLPDSCVGLELVMSEGVTDRVFLADVQDPLDRCRWTGNPKRTVMIDQERGTPIHRDVVWVRKADVE